jgi:hypothetical protein
MVMVQDCKTEECRDILQQLEWHGHGKQQDQVKDGKNNVEED